MVKFSLFFPPELKQWPHPTHSLTCKSHTCPLLRGKARSQSRPFAPRVKHVQVCLLPYGWDGLLPTSLTFPCERHSGHCGLAFQSSSVQSLSRVRLFVTPWIATRQASLPITNSRSSLKLMSIESVMPSSHLILCRPLLLLLPIPPRRGLFCSWMDK